VNKGNMVSVDLYFDSGSMLLAQATKLRESVDEFLNRVHHGGLRTLPQSEYLELLEALRILSGNPALRDRPDLQRLLGHLEVALDDVRAGRMDLAQFAGRLNVLGHELSDSIVTLSNYIVIGAIEGEGEPVRAAAEYYVGPLGYSAPSEDKPFQVSEGDNADPYGYSAPFVLESGHPSVKGAIYIADSDVRPVVALRLINALKLMAEESGYTVVDTNPPVLGSWFQDFRIRLRSDLTPEQAHRATQKLAQGVEDALLNQRSAEIAKINSETVANLMHASQGCNNFAAVLGSVLLVKHTDSSGMVHVKTKILTVGEQRLLERENWKSLRDPESLLMELERGVATAEIPSSGDVVVSSEST
jgi:hypothetical protein